MDNQSNDAAHYKRVAEEMREHYDGLVARLAKAELTNELQDARIGKLTTNNVNLKKHLAHLRAENDALRSMVPTDCDVEVVQHEGAYDQSGEPEQVATERKTVELLVLDPYTDLKVPRF